MIIGYARVSTKDQSLDLQLDALKKAGAHKIYTDEISGSKMDRTGLNLVFAGLREGDTVVVWKLDRLARSLSGFIDLVNRIEEAGANFKSITEAIDTSTATGKFFFHTMASLSEMERELIIERTKAGLHAARQRGALVGRRRAMTEAKISSAAALYATGIPVREIAEALGVSTATLYRTFKETQTSEPKTV